MSNGDLHKYQMMRVLTPIGTWLATIGIALIGYFGNAQLEAIKDSNRLQWERISENTKTNIRQEANILDLAKDSEEHTERLGIHYGYIRELERANDRRDGAEGSR